MGTGWSRKREEAEAMVDAVALIVVEFPREHRVYVLRSFIELFKKLNGSGPTPEWISILEDMADREFKPVKR